MLEFLESRRLFAAVYPTDVEQYEVQLINRARANPSAEAARDNIDLNEGLAPGTISTAAKQPLAINPFLTDASRGHSQWMIDNNTFAHNEGSVDPGTRDANAGYNFSGSYSWGENIAFRAARPSVPDPYTTAGQLQNDLFIDSSEAGRGHRTNMMNGAFKEVGAGLVSGTYQGYNAVMLTTDFAYSGTGNFLTGVVYSDASHDNFYTPGEGLSGVTITARRSSDGSTFTTQSWSSGGYSLPLTDGTYSVSATGGRLTAAVNYGTVVVNSQNVEADFTPTTVSNTPTSSGTGTIRGAVFNDLNHNGLRDTNEPGVAGVLVYLDEHHDGKRNHGEPYARTNSDGAYKLTNVPLAVYRVRETLPDNFTLYAPKAGFLSVNVNAADKIFAGRNFADQIVDG